jgi:hypothetical protein
MVSEMADVMLLAASWACLKRFLDVERVMIGRWAATLLAMASATACSPQDSDGIAFCAVSNYLGADKVPERILFNLGSKTIQVGDVVYPYEVVESGDAEGILYPYFIALPKNHEFAQGVSSVAFGGVAFDVAPSAGGDIWLISSREWQAEKGREQTDGDTMRSSIIYSKAHGVLAIQNSWRKASGQTTSRESVRCDGKSVPLHSFAK